MKGFYKMKFKNELEIDVFRCLRAIKTRWKFILLIAVLCFAIGVGYTFDKGSDMYVSRATVYAASNGSYSETTTAVTAMNAYVTVATSRKVCERAALLIGREDVSADSVMRSVRVSTAVDSKTTNVMISSATIITFAAYSAEPELCVQMADAMAKAYVIEMENILGNDSIKLLDSAYRYDKYLNAFTSAWKKRIIFGFAGILVGMLIVVFFEIFDSKVRTIREASVRGELPIIGVIPDNK